MVQTALDQTETDPVRAEQTGDSGRTSSAGLPSVSGEKPAGPAPSAGWAQPGTDNEFDYIPVSPWAPIALVLGLLALTGFIGVFGLYVAFFGICVGLAAMMRIRSSEGFVKGMWMAVAGFVLSLAAGSLGSAKMYYAWRTEVPEGYQRVNFPKEICEKEFVFVNGVRKLHPDVAPLLGKKIYIKGFMWATQDANGLANFILLKDNGECCFGGRPKSHDYVWVKLAGFNKGEPRPALSFRSDCMEVKELSPDAKEKLGLTTDYQLTTRSFLGMVAVAGVMQADVKAGKSGRPDDFDYAPVYTMDAELVEEAWTRF